MAMAFLTVLFALLVSMCSAQSEVCSVCQLIVSYAEKFIATNSSEAAIIQQLDNLCGDIPLFGQQCQSIVNQYAPQLIDWILNKENPQEFCSQVGLCSSLNREQARPRHRMIHRPHHQVRHKRAAEAEDQATCSICSLVVTYVEKWVAQNQTESQIIAQLQAFCSNLGPLAPECNSFVATYAPQIITWIENKEPPQTVCTQIGACTSRKQVRIARANAVKQLNQKRNAEQGVCQVCQLVVTYVEQLVAQNNTIAEIEQQVDAMCALLPSPINGACTSVVNQYLPQLVAWIIQKEDPSTFCSTVGLC